MCPGARPLVLDFVLAVAAERIAPAGAIVGPEQASDSFGRLRLARIVRSLRGEILQLRDLPWHGLHLLVQGVHSLLYCLQLLLLLLGRLLRDRAGRRCQRQPPHTRLRKMRR